MPKSSTIFENTRLRSRARHNIASRLIYDDNNKFSAQFKTRFHGDYLPADDSIEPNKTHSFTTFDMALNYKLHKNVNFTLSIENIFDKKVDDASEYGRLFYTSLNFKF